MSVCTGIFASAEWVSNGIGKGNRTYGYNGHNEPVDGLVDKGFLIAEGENRGRKYYLTGVLFSGYNE